MNRSIFIFQKNKNKNIKNLFLNFGPQHPAAHGVLRMMLKINSEYITKTDVHIGLLHRGTEKLMESKMYIHSLPYFDRFDYVSMMVQEHAYCLSIEKLLKKSFFKKNFNLVRTLFDELTRILNHLLAIACHALDVGSMSPIFWGFEEREKILEFYERVSGARMHAAFYRPGKTFINNLSTFLIEDINYFCSNCITSINEINFLLINNKIWKRRLINVGQFNWKFAINNNLTGVLLRSTGINNDIRLNINETYANYFYINFKSYVTNNGDCYDRYILRIVEMFESLHIINQVIFKLNKPGSCSKKFFKTNKDKVYKNMESLIKHFKYWSEGIKINSNIVNSSVESPKGEFSVFINSDGTNKPNRVKVKSPAFYSLQVLKKLSVGHLLADLITLIGTIDVVFGEIDR